MELTSEQKAYALRWAANYLEQHGEENTALESLRYCADMTEKHDVEKNFRKLIDFDRLSKTCDLKDVSTSFCLSTDIMTITSLKNGASDWVDLLVSSDFLNGVGWNEAHDRIANEINALNRGVEQ
jgi:hypothetical protein